jgi:hypothetical protein
MPHPPGSNISAAALCIGLIGFPSFPREADFSTERISFEIPLPLDGITLPDGPYLVSGKIIEKNSPLGSFYRIPRLILPCKGKPCTVNVTAQVKMKDVSEELVRAIMVKKCPAHFLTAFQSVQTKKISELDLPLDLTPEAMGIGPESAQNLIRIESQSITAKNRSFTFDLVLQNPFSFPLKLRWVRVKVEPVPRSVYDQSFEFDEPLPPGETTKTLGIPLKPGDLLYLVADKVLQEDYTLKMSAGMEGTIRIEIAGEKVEVPFGSQ